MWLIFFVASGTFLPNDYPRPEFIMTNFYNNKTLISLRYIINISNKVKIKIDLKINKQKIVIFFFRYFYLNSIEDNLKGNKSTKK